MVAGRVIIVQKIHIILVIFVVEVLEIVIIKLIVTVNTVWMSMRKFVFGGFADAEHLDIEEQALACQRMVEVELDLIRLDLTYKCFGEIALIVRDRQDHAKLKLQVLGKHLAINDLNICRSVETIAVTGGEFNFFCL